MLSWGDGLSVSNSRDTAEHPPVGNPCANRSIRLHGMRQRTKHFLALVSAQAACLAFGLWLDNRLVLAVVHDRSERGHVASAPVGSSMAMRAMLADARSAPDSAMRARSSCHGNPRDDVPLDCRVQTVVAYLSLTRMQEVVTRRQTETERASLQRHNDLLRTRDAVIFGLAGLADSRDPETGKHLERIAAYQRAWRRHWPAVPLTETRSALRL